MKDVLYHGTTVSGLKTLEPQERYKPEGAEESIQSAIYATDDTAFAAAHAFPWSSDEGIDLSFYDGKLELTVPESLKDRLYVPITIYTVPSSTFSLTEEETTGHTYHSTEPVDILESETFENVTEAVEAYGGTVTFR